MKALGEDKTPVLSIDSVRKTYGQVNALADVTLRVDGGIVGLIGANGAGKSTLFRAILDLVMLDAGSIEVAGFDTRREPMEARSRIGYLPEELHLYERLSGKELLRLVAALKGRGTEDEQDELLDYFGLAERAHVLIGEYSLGMRKKIGIACALLGSPPLILLDEPLNGLDTESMRRLRLKIEEIERGGTTFVISSHVMSFVERICERTVILRQGQVVADATPSEVRRQVGMEGEPFEDVFLHLAL